MSIWVKADSCQVYMHISGAVCSEHIDFLEYNLLNRLHYGYRRIIINMQNVSMLDSEGAKMLSYVRDQVSRKGGELIIEGCNF
ncbi:STAS domain-containing protein [Dendrosporobacter sp. 1207_IL3150]|uniref:STAS domain-containing protein n=1 Tax=Dendrosporobacter sp. 1207_IL3150 TaxID=3084054 RepID=UPI002FDA30D7